VFVSKFIAVFKNEDLIPSLIPIEESHILMGVLKIGLDLHCIGGTTVDKIFVAHFFCLNLS